MDRIKKSNTTHRPIQYLVARVMRFETSIIAMRSLEMCSSCWKVQTILATGVTGLHQRPSRARVTYHAGDHCDQAGLVDAAVVQDRRLEENLGTTRDPEQSTATQFSTMFIVKTRIRALCEPAAPLLGGSETGARSAPAYCLKVSWVYYLSGCCRRSAG